MMLVSLNAFQESSDLFVNVRLERQAIRIPRLQGDPVTVIVGLRRGDLRFQLPDNVNLSPRNGPRSRGAGYDIYVNPETVDQLSLVLRFVAIDPATYLTLSRRLRVGIITVTEGNGGEVSISFTLPSGHNDIVIDSYGSFQEILCGFPREKRLVFETLVSRQAAFTLMQGQDHLARQILTVRQSDQ